MHTLVLLPWKHVSGKTMKNLYKENVPYWNIFVYFESYVGSVSVDFDVEKTKYINPEN